MRLAPFSGEDALEQFLSKIARIRALGITDYYSLDAYEIILEKKNQRRLPDVELIFLNVEMRYAIGTIRGLPINVHPLVSLEDPNHVDELRRFLRNFTFTAYGEVFRCD
jgi:hypothetical protein